MVTVAVRAEVAELAFTLKITVPLPVPVAPFLLQHASTESPGSALVWGLEPTEFPRDLPPSEALGEC